MYSKKAIDCSDSMEKAGIVRHERRDKQKSRQRYKSRRLSGLCQDPCPSNGPTGVVRGLADTVLPVSLVICSKKHI